MSNQNLAVVLTVMELYFKDQIDASSSKFSLVDILEFGKKLGFSNVFGGPRELRTVYIPLGRVSGIGSEFDSNEFNFGYTQLKSGIFLKDWFVEEARLEGEKYNPPSNSMNLYKTSFLGKILK